MTDGIKLKMEVHESTSSLPNRVCENSAVEYSILYLATNKASVSGADPRVSELLKPTMTKLMMAQKAQFTHTSTSDASKFSCICFVTCVDCFCDALCRQITALVIGRVRPSNDNERDLSAALVTRPITSAGTEESLLDIRRSPHKSESSQHSLTQSILPKLANYHALKLSFDCQQLLVHQRSLARRLESTAAIKHKNPSPQQNNCVGT